MFIRLGASFREQYDLDEFLKLIEETASQLQATVVSIKQFITETPMPTQQDSNWGRS